MDLKRFPVEASHILMFARAVGDENPVYADADYARTTEAGGIIAPPTFAAAGVQFDPNHSLRPRPGKPWLGSGRNPTGLPPDTSAGAGGGGLHAEQHFEYHRHLKPGDVLTATTKPGKTWEKEGRRSGKLIFTELLTEYRDQHGELVITARAVGVRTERPVDQR
jgi:acyl dehydratase